MQLQLSMTVADRLHEVLLLRGEPLGVAEAVGLLVASTSCPVSLCRHVVDTLVEYDRRFCLVHGDEEEAGPRRRSDHRLTERVSLRTWETPDPDLADVAFVALDLETTGARPGTHKITEIGALRFEGLREVGRFGTLINPMRPIPPMIAQITGITADMVAGAPRIEQVLPELIEFLDGAVVVAHNAGFDVAFLNYELRRLKGRRLSDGAIDTLALARALVPGLPNYRLGTVAEALGAPVAACHRALADAAAVGHVFTTLARRLQEAGLTRLGQVRSCAGLRPHAAVEKLPLSRDIPQAPGTYRFLDRDGRVIYVGRADVMRERVRSYFVAGASPNRKVRRAIRSVEHIDWEETLTPLEAVVKEQELILQHRPPCNLHGGRPENYSYIKLVESRFGLQLQKTARGPLPNYGDGPPRGNRRGNTVLLGPFRGRSRLESALRLLRASYPIRDCPRRPNGRPCVRGQTDRCLAPCHAGPAARLEHDGLVRELLDWIAGSDMRTAPSPEEMVDELTRQHSEPPGFEQAQQARDALEDLLSIRRSYASLVETQTLSFASLRPVGNGDGVSEVRLNVVWRGRPVHQMTLSRETAADRIDSALSSFHDGRNHQRLSASSPAYVAVPQQDLDTLLAIRGWFIGATDPSTIILREEEPSAHAPRAWRERVLAEALKLLREQGPRRQF